MNREKKQLVVFGYGLAVIFGLIAFHLWRHHGWHAAHVILFLCIVGLIVITGVRYPLLKPVYRQWMRVAHLIGSVITGIILSILFYLIFGVAGIVLRIIRKDLLDQRMDRGIGSYWIDRPETVFEKRDYTRQF